MIENPIYPVTGTIDNTTDRNPVPVEPPEVEFLVEVCEESPPRAPDKWAIRINRRWIADYEYEFEAQEVAARLRAALLRPAATEGGP